MKKKYLKSVWRKLDNTAKIFSLEADSNINIFRYSVVFKKNIEKDILIRAVNVSLEKYSLFKVKCGEGIFWNYLEYNDKEIIISKEDNIPCQIFDFNDNNDYLFRVSYYKNKINLDVFHVLTDGNGAIRFLKEIIHNYLCLKYNDKFYESSNICVEYTDQYLECVDKKYKAKYEKRSAFHIKGKSADINNCYHYVVNVSDVKKVSKEYGITITEYLTALYIYAMYLTIYDKRNNRDIVINVPIDLRKFYKVDTMSNFFTCMNVHAKLLENNIRCFDDVVKLVHEEFREKLTFDCVKEYLYKGVALGMNLPIRLVPLFIKKIFINCACKLIGRTVTTTLSNVGMVDIDEEYRKDIDNIYVMVLPGKVQKIKCTVCSYNDKLNITMNSNIDDVIFERKFYSLLKKNVSMIRVVSNTNIKFK